MHLFDVIVIFDNFVIKNHDWWCSSPVCQWWWLNWLWHRLLCPKLLDHATITLNHILTFPVKCHQQLKMAVGQKTNDNKEKDDKHPEDNLNFSVSQTGSLPGVVTMASVTRSTSHTLTRVASVQVVTRCQWCHRSPPVSHPLPLHIGGARCIAENIFVLIFIENYKLMLLELCQIQVLFYFSMKV